MGSGEPDTVDVESVAPTLLGLLRGNADKVRSHPTLYELSAASFATAEALLQVDLGGGKAVCPPELLSAAVTPGQIEVWYLDERCLVSEQKGKPVVHVTTVTLPRTRYALEQLATTSTGDPPVHDRRVAIHDEEVRVVVTIDPVRVPGSLALHQFQVRELYGRLAATARDLTGPGAGWDDLVETFTQAGFALPRLPIAARKILRSVEPWHWTTRADTAAPADPSPMADYLLESASWLERPVPDHVTVSRSGHGLNSYAVTWRMAQGPVAFAVQAADGRLDGPNLGAMSMQASLFSRAAALLETNECRAEQQPAAEERQSSPGPSMRRVLVVASDLRGCRVSWFDGSQQRWVTLAETGNADDDAFWQVAVAAVAKAETVR